MKRYKYIGTEKQLIEHGYTMNGDFAYKETDLKVVWYDDKLLYDNVIVSFHKSEYRHIYWDMWDENKNDITPYIQDLINDGLVEVMEI